MSLKKIKIIFFQTAINAESVILKYYPIDKYEKIKNIAFGVGLITGALILAVPFLDGIDGYNDKQFNIGVNMVNKMTLEEKKIFRELHRLIKELESCLKWDLVAEDYYKKHGAGNYKIYYGDHYRKYGDILIRKETFGDPIKEYYFLSSILRGIFKGFYLK